MLVIENREGTTFAGTRDWGSRKRGGAKWVTSILQYNVGTM